MAGSQVYRVRFEVGEPGSFTTSRCSYSVCRSAHDVRDGPIEWALRLPEGVVERVESEVRTQKFRPASFCYEQPAPYSSTVNAIDPDKLNTCLMVLADIQSLPPEHPDAVAVRRATAGIFK